MKRSDRLVVLATERRGHMTGVTQDGRVLVLLDDTDEPVSFLPHDLELVAVGCPTT